MNVVFLPHSARKFQLHTTFIGPLACSSVTAIGITGTKIAYRLVIQAVSPIGLVVSEDSRNALTLAK